MDIDRLFYKIGKREVEATHYVEWAYYMVEQQYNAEALHILAFLEEPLNIFEVEHLFKRACMELNLQKPTYEEQRNGQVQYLLQQILMDEQRAIALAYEVYAVYRNDMYMDDPGVFATTWYSISEVIDDFLYGDNANDYSLQQVIQTIVEAAKAQMIQAK